MNDTEKEIKLTGIFPAPLVRGRRPQEQTVYAWLWYHADSKLKCYPSLSTLSAECGMSIPSIILALTSMEKDGLLTKQKRKRKKTGSTANNRYDLLPPTKGALVGGTKGALVGGTKGALVPLLKDVDSIYKENTLGDKDPQSDCNFSQEKKKKKKKRFVVISPAKKLAKIVTSQRNIKIDQNKLKAWSNDIRKLHTKEGVSIARIKQVMKWYASSIGGQYVPVIHSGRSFRSKFLTLEAAMGRDGVDVSVRKEEARPRIRIGAQQEE